MVPCKCDFCFESQAYGELFHRGGVRICRVCRDYVLTYLSRLNIPMADTNPFIRELCEHTHYVKSAWWDYSNSDLQTRKTILQLRKKSDSQNSA